MTSNTMLPLLVRPSTHNGQGQYQDPWGAHTGTTVPVARPADPMPRALVPSQPSQQYGNVDPFAVFAAAPAPKSAPAAVVPFVPAIQELVAGPAPPKQLTSPAPPKQFAAPSPSKHFAAPAPPKQFAAPAPPKQFAVPNPPKQFAAPDLPKQSGDDFWANMGFGARVADAQKQPQAGQSGGEAEKSPAPSEELPPGGKWYDTRIFTPTLGVMFFKPHELTDSLFLHTDKSIVDALEERPVVAYIVEGSSARSAGVELGHVLLKVNGIDIKDPKDASRLIKEGPRPLPLLFYVPDTNVVIAEGEHMVKYDTRETTAPGGTKDWKPKYVVIGGIIAQPWMMNMYRSKSEYDIAVIESQARRPISVKVKQFSLQGARIQNDWQGPQMVKYKNTLHPWKYIVILQVERNPIKISSPDLIQLRPVHEGIRRMLQSQQRDRGQHVHPTAPVQGGPYSRPQDGRGGDPQEGIQRVLLSQQRDRGQHISPTAPVRGDPYSRPQNGHGGDPHQGIPPMLLSQQRDRSQHAHTAAPVQGDPYAHPQNGHGGDPQGGIQRDRGKHVHNAAPIPVRGDPYARPQNGHGGDPHHSHGGSGGDPYTRGGGKGGDPYALRGSDSYAQGRGGGLL